MKINLNYMTEYRYILNKQKIEILYLDIFYEHGYTFVIINQPKQDCSKIVQKMIVRTKSYEVTCIQSP